MCSIVRCKGRQKKESVLAHRLSIEKLIEVMKVLICYANHPLISNINRDFLCRIKLTHYICLCIIHALWFDVGTYTSMNSG